eukprot:3818551-Pleurochrysis_carterae.AAC.1
MRDERGSACRLLTLQGLDLEGALMDACLAVGFVYERKLLLLKPAPDGAPGEGWRSVQLSVHTLAERRISFRSVITAVQQIRQVA